MNDEPLVVIEACYPRDINWPAEWHALETVYESAATATLQYWSKYFQITRVRPLKP